MKTSMREEIIKIVDEKANNNPAPEKCTIIESNNGFVKVKLINGSVLSNLPVLGNPTPFTDAIVTYINGESNSPLIVPSVDENLTMILALGLGLFKIKSDGHLYVELPNGISNFFTLDNNGHLLVTLPDGVSNDYHLENDGHLYYYREE